LDFGELRDTGTKPTLHRAVTIAASRVRRPPSQLERRYNQVDRLPESAAHLLVSTKIIANAYLSPKKNSKFSDRCWQALLSAARLSNRDSEYT
jgi:hypothetical protein